MTTLNLDAMKADADALRRELESAGVKFRGNNCRCPFHDDQHASAGIFLHDGHWLFKCQTCNVTGSIIDVRARLNKRTPAEELRAMNDAATPPPMKKLEPPPQVYPSIDALKASFQTLEDCYLYRHPQTAAVELVVVRYWNTLENRKAFVQCHPVKGGFIKKGLPAPWPLYNRARVAKAEQVIVVEGEKCVHALHVVGIVATTSPGGAGKAANADWTPLAGKVAFLWPDADPPNPPTHPKPGVRTGIAHMRDVQAILQTLNPPCQVYWIDPDPLELPPKGDAADMLERYGDMTPAEKRAAIEAAVLAEAEPIDTIGGYLQSVEDAIAGKRRAIPFPWKMLSNATRALLPGTVTCFVGDAGSGKSLAIMESVICWNELGFRPAVYELEDDKNYHLARAHAQLAKNSGLTDSAWIEGNGDLARASTATHRKALMELERCLWESPNEQATLGELATWAEERAKAGHDIIVIDPVTAAVPEGKPWIADCQFIVQVKTIAKKYGVRVVLVVHPKKGYGGKGGTLDDLAGGAAYGRFSHTVIWLEVYDKEEELPVRANLRHPPENLLPNRIAKVVKTRNGPGRGKRFAMDFDAASLTFRELGLIERSA